MIQPRRLSSPRLASIDGALRQSLLRALARDLSLPQDHFAVTATMQALATVSLKKQTLVVEGEPVDEVPERLVDVSLDTWCCVAACALARDTAA
jgi:hypothetical protein